MRAEALDELETAVEGIRRAAALVSALRGRAAPLTARVERFDAAAVAASCVVAERAFARQAGAALEADLGAHPVFLYGDPDRLHQVFVNLIRNAVAASQGAGVGADREDAARVDLAPGRLRGELAIVVRDRGVGIPPEHLERIFEPGYSSKLAGESGLGLAVVEDIVRGTFGGTVEVESEVGRGTAFTIRIPLPAQRRASGPGREGDPSKRFSPVGQ